MAHDDGCAPYFNARSRNSDAHHYTYSNIDSLGSHDYLAREYAESRSDARVGYHPSVSRDSNDYQYSDAVADRADDLG